MLLKLIWMGDGQDEVFVQAYHDADMIGNSEGILYMRKVMEGKLDHL